MTEEPPFIPREGQIDYTNIRRAPVINCIVMNKGKILLVHRSPNMRLYPNIWSGVSGFLDEPAKTVEEKVREELHEELGVRDEDILSIREAPATIEVSAPEYDKVWIVRPALVELATRDVRLDWEAQDCAWVSPDEARAHDHLVPGFTKLLDAFAL